MVKRAAATLLTTSSSARTSSVRALALAASRTRLSLIRQGGENKRLSLIQKRESTAIEVAARFFHDSHKCVAGLGLHGLQRPFQAYERRPLSNAKESLPSLHRTVTCRWIVLQIISYSSPLELILHSCQTKLVALQAFANFLEHT